MSLYNAFCGFFTKNETKPIKIKTYYTPNNANYYTMHRDFYNDGSHMLIAGTTGSGKSVFINGFIYSLLAFTSPASARFVLIDPKRVELSKYKNLPQTIAYGCDNENIIQILEWVSDLMEKRYTRMQAEGTTRSTEAPIYVIIDELADLMTTCKRQIMPLLQHLLQLGRAANIRIVAATQAPNRKVIPAELTLNFNLRIALHCLSAIESKQIINAKGAEELPRYGRCILLSPEGYKTLSVPMVSDAELKNRIDFWKAQN